MQGIIPLWLAWAILITGAGIAIVGLILSAKLPDKRVRQGYVMALLSLTIGVGALWLSNELWPLIGVPGAAFGVTVFRHLFFRHFLYQAS